MLLNRLKTYSNRIFSVLLLCSGVQASERLLGDELDDLEKNAAVNISQSLTYFASNLSGDQNVGQAIKVLKDVFESDQKSNLMIGLLIAKNDSLTEKTSRLFTHSDGANYLDFKDKIYSFFTSFTAETAPYHIKSFFYLTLGKGSSFYSRNDGYGFNSIFKDCLKEENDDAINNNPDAIKSPSYRRKNKNKQECSGVSLESCTHEGASANLTLKYKYGIYTISNFMLSPFSEQDWINEFKKLDFKGVKKCLEFFSGSAKKDIYDAVDHSDGNLPANFTGEDFLKLAKDRNSKLHRVLINIKNSNFSLMKTLPEMFKDAREENNGMKRVLSFISLPFSMNLLIRHMIVHCRDDL